MLVVGKSPTELRLCFDSFRQSKAICDSCPPLCSRIQQSKSSLFLPSSERSPCQRPADNLLFSLVVPLYFGHGYDRQ
jgi:hypothetical protein